jgi:hypothetical protein
MGSNVQQSRIPVSAETPQLLASADGKAIADTTARKHDIRKSNIGEILTYWLFGRCSAPGATSFVLRRLIQHGNFHDDSHNGVGSQQIKSPDIDGTNKGYVGLEEGGQIQHSMGPSNKVCRLVD